MISLLKHFRYCTNLVFLSTEIISDLCWTWALQAWILVSLTLFCGIFHTITQSSAKLKYYSVLQHYSGRKVLSVTATQNNVLTHSAREFACTLLQQPDNLGFLCWSTATAHHSRALARQLHKLILIILQAYLRGTICLMSIHMFKTLHMANSSTNISIPSVKYIHTHTSEKKNCCST